MSVFSLYYKQRGLPSTGHPSAVLPPAAAALADATTPTKRINFGVIASATSQPSH
jgi:hypothetical protein